MPWVSQAQRRKFYALEAEGKLPKGTCAKWEEHTVDKNLPERVEKKAFEMGAGAALDSFGVKIAWLPALASGLMTAGRAALPWLARTFGGQTARAAGASAVGNAAAGAAMGGMSGGWQGARDGAVGGAISGGLMGGIGAKLGPKGPASIGQV